MNPNEKNPQTEAIRLYNLFNFSYSYNTPAQIRIARQIACKSAQAHIDQLRIPSIGIELVRFYALVYNELETIKKSI
jgi:hypothetical protein